MQKIAYYSRGEQAFVVDETIQLYGNINEYLNMMTFDNGCLLAWIIPNGLTIGIPSFYP